MWSSRSSILKTVLEMADTWRFDQFIAKSLLARWSARTEQSKGISGGSGHFEIRLGLGGKFWHHGPIKV